MDHQQTTGDESAAFAVVAEEATMNVQDHTISAGAAFGDEYHLSLPKIHHRRLADPPAVKILGVMVTTKDRAPTTTSAQMGKALFGNGDGTVNLKTQMAQCSNNAATMEKAEGEGRACVDNNFGHLGLTPGRAKIDCDYLTIFKIQFPDRIAGFCRDHGDKPDLDGGPSTANQACCACGGGAEQNFRVTDGMLEIRVPRVANGVRNTAIAAFAIKRLQEIFSTNNLRTKFDWLMLCLPWGTVGERDGFNWSARNDYSTIFNDVAGGSRCVNAPLMLHEMGHNWGLEHSSDEADGPNVIDIEYGDTTGAMGDVADSPTAKLCFNGAHSWQLDWYTDDQYLDVFPLERSYDEELAGVGKLPGIGAREKLVLKITDTDTSYYIMYNHKIGANAGTLEHGNKVTIVTQPDVDTVSSLQEGLPAGGEYSIEDFQGTDTTIIIEVVEIDASPSGFARVIIYARAPPPTSGPTSIPTSTPTSTPTSAPTSAPTSGPTDGPTDGLSSMPSSGPSAQPSTTPSWWPTVGPTVGPTFQPTGGPTSEPTSSPTSELTTAPTSGSTKRPTSLPTASPTSGPTAVPTPGPPTSSPTSSPHTSDPTSRPTTAPNPLPTPEIGNDPHITTWSNEHYEFHGQCDLVMLYDNTFASGLGLDIHIRTKLVRFWSYIKSASIRIGNDILEVEGHSDHHSREAIYWINYEYQGELNDIGGFPVSYEAPAPNKSRYEIDLSSKYPNTKITIQIYEEFVRVRMVNDEAAFGNSMGLLGEFHTGKTLARDGATILDDYSTLGNEWQVLPAEPKLFHELSYPQFPERCIEPEDPRGERRRRLDESSITEEAAETACSVALKDPLSIKDCVYDVLATQNLDMVGAF